MNRADLQALAEMRIADAKALLDTGRFAGAYYLAGYALECAIKAFVAKQTNQFDFPDKTLVEKVYKHDPEALIRGAGLEQTLTDEMDKDGQFAVNWAEAKTWSEKSRYSPTVDKQKAQDLIAALSDGSHGVLQWLKRFW